MKKLVLTILTIAICIASLAQENARARKFYEIGNKLYKNKQYKEAIAELSKAIKLDSLFAEAYFARCQAFRSIRESEKAFSDIQRYIRLNNKNANAYLERSFIRRELIDAKHGHFYASTEDIDKETLLAQIADIDLALMIDSLNDKAYTMKAGCLEFLCMNSSYLGYYANCDSLYKESIRLMSKAISLNPKEGYYYYRATSRLEIRDTTGACSDSAKQLNLMNRIVRGYTMKFAVVAVNNHR